MSYYGDRDRGDRDRGGDRARPNPCRLYVGNINRYVREQDLKDLFSRYGRVRDFILRDYYAFIEFDSVREADDAAKELNGYRLEDDRLVVQVANVARNRLESRDRDSRRNRDRDYRSDRGRRDAQSSDSNDRCYNCGEFGWCFFNTQRLLKSIDIMCISLHIY
ncbi:hypothetical protein EDC96DRAFT_334913 [Choanephora cucurbitarum]|nr:hypothetical protein EDC96DRAFT_334913 [Choanephora cucurbitarum]